MPILHALDLTELPGSDALWRPHRNRDREYLERLPGLPSEGFASPLGYWFAAAGSWATGVETLRVEVLELAEMRVENRAVAREAADGGARNGVCRVRLELAAVRGRSDETSPSSRLLLEIDARTARARVGVDAGAWPGLS